MKASLILSCTLAFSACCWAATASGQDQPKPLFPGAEYLESCTADLPPTYSEKDTARYTKAALALKGVELIYLTTDKKGEHVNYERVYVEVNTIPDHSVFIHYIGAASYGHKDKNGSTMDLIVVFDPRSKIKQRFYLAKCFDEQVATHLELKRVLKEKH